MAKLKYFLQESWLLLASSFCFGLLIAMTNTALSGRIEQNKAAKLNDLTKALLPGAEIFQPVEAEIQVERPDGAKEKAKIFEVLSGDKQRLGWSFNAHGTGFAGPVELVLAVDKDFQKIMGMNVLASSETPGFGDQIKSDYYRKQYAGAPAEQLTLAKSGDPTVADAQIVAITGATVSSQAVVEIVNTFLTQIKSQMQEKGLIANDNQ
ncbi:MAG: FMN-binding protein [Planctomycetes bacterium]|nr:FMN-binding protein [Planctomycetota bacterium]